jgi:hypothetical protein
MVNLPINLDFFKFSSFFASLKGRVSPAMAGKSVPHRQSPEFEVRLGRPPVVGRVLFHGHVVSALADDH